MPTSRLFVLAILAAALATGACSSSGATRRTSPSGSGAAIKPTEASASAVDSRVIVVRRRERVPLILVNWSHEKRQPAARDAGPTWLAMNGNAASYYVLDDSDFDALVNGLNQAGWRELASPFDQDREAELLWPDQVADPDYLGMILLERGGVRTRLLGIRNERSGDYATFYKMRGLAYEFAQTRGQTETPGSSYLDRMAGR